MIQPDSLTPNRALHEDLNHTVSPVESDIPQPRKMRLLKVAWPFVRSLFPPILSLGLLVFGGIPLNAMPSAHHIPVWLLLAATMRILLHRRALDTICPYNGCISRHEESHTSLSSAKAGPRLLDTGGLCGTCWRVSRRCLHPMNARAQWDIVWSVFARAKTKRIIWSRRAVQ